MRAHCLLDNIANAGVSGLGTSLIELKLSLDIFGGESNTYFDASRNATCS